MFRFVNSKPIQFLLEISKLPRETGMENQIKDYLISFAKNRNLEFFTDEFNNVIIYKRENLDAPIISLQTNIDMISIKTLKSKIDFKKQGASIIKRADFILGKNTSFGGESACGIAIILDILDSKLPVNIEAIFTSQKYNNMLGARALDLKKITSNNMICLCGGEKDSLYNESCYSIQGQIKFNNEKIFLLNSILRKTFTLSIEGLGSISQNNYIKVICDLLSKFSNLFINKYYFGRDREYIFKNQVTFTTEIDELELKRIIKFFYIQNKKIYPKIKIKCIRQINNSLVLENSNFLSFLSNFKHGNLKSDEFLYQEITNIDSDSGIISFRLVGKNIKSTQRQYELLEELCRNNNMTCIHLYDCESFKTKENSSLLSGFTKSYIGFGNVQIKPLLSDNEGGVFQDRNKNLDVICLPIFMLENREITEKVSYSSMINTSMWLKKYFREEL